MPGSRRVCIFCDGTGLTAEHVLPRWLQTVLEPPGGLTFQTVGMDGQRFERNLDLSALAQRARVVCGGCNHGWMSRLENRAKSILAPMIDPTGHESFELDAEAQEVIAFWTVKTAILVQSVLPEHRRLASRRLRRRTFKDQSPPMGTVVWIGRRERPDHGVLVHAEPLQLVHIGLLPEFDRFGRPLNAAFACTFVVGGLFIHALLFEGADLQPDHLNTDPKTVCIRPFVSPMTWPLEDGLSDVKMWEIAGALPRLDDETRARLEDKMARDTRRAEGPADRRVARASPPREE